MHWCYIIYSPSIDKFYTGETANPETRIFQHNQGYFENSFTSQVSDWEIFITIPCRDRSHARKVEGFIKSMKSKKFILRLKIDVSLVASISNRF